MRILIGYDGSVAGDGALYDLRSAGLPAVAEAVVLSVATPWVPYGPGGDPAAEGWGIQAAEIRDFSRQVLEDAGNLAERGARFLRTTFPGWTVQAQAVIDDPARGILEKAKSWKPNLIVLGSHGRSAVASFLLGSVSHRVLNHADTCVRISRPRIADWRSGEGPAPVLLLAMDGSQGAEDALDVLVSRIWPEGTEVHVIAVVQGRTAREEIREREEACALALQNRKAGKTPIGHQVLTWIERKVETACSRLAQAHLRPVPVVLAGEPRRVLVREARLWTVQAIFMGSRGLNPVGRLMLGSVSSAVAAHAPCTVEVVHSSRISARNLTSRSIPKLKTIRQR